MDGTAPAEVRGTRWRVVHGDCLEVMARMRSASVDAVVTDPPYGLSFMNSAWDHGVPGVPYWTEALRVAKPGAHLLAFGGTRTFHRLAVAIEDAGWEIRDDVLRLMSQDEGFKALWATLDAAQQHALAEVLNQHGMSGCLAWNYGSGFPKSHNLDGAWEGWGTALKPAWEPIIVARKPLAGTVARNVAEHGTGALNIDGTRIATDEALGRLNHTPSTFNHKNTTPLVDNSRGLGRWPANVILDEEAASQLDAQSGPRGAAAAASGPSLRGENRSVARGKYNGLPEGQAPAFHGDSGGASRFFYVAKASRSERWEYLTCDCEAGTVPVWVNEVRSRREPTDSMSRQGATSEDAAPMDDFDSSTASSGSITTDRSPQGTKSTIGTSARLTTGSRTLPLSTSRHTSASTEDANFGMVSGGSSAATVVNESPSTPGTGTSRAKAGLSTGVAAPAMFARSWRGSVCGNCGALIRSEGHATVKPVEVMRWLVRLVTPPGGIVLDPFTGSGTTGVAALREGTNSASTGYLLATRPGPLPSVPPPSEMRGRMKVNQRSSTPPANFWVDLESGVTPSGLNLRRYHAA